MFILCRIEIDHGQLAPINGVHIHGSSSLCRLGANSSRTSGSNYKLLLDAQASAFTDPPECMVSIPFGMPSPEYCATYTACPLPDHRYQQSTPSDYPRSCWVGTTLGITDIFSSSPVSVLPCWPRCLGLPRRRHRVPPPADEASGFCRKGNSPNQVHKRSRKPRLPVCHDLEVKGVCAQARRPVRGREPHTHHSGPSDKPHQSMPQCARGPVAWQPVRSRNVFVS